MTTRPVPRVRQTLVRAAEAVMHRPWETARVVFVAQGVVVLVGIPFLGWLFPTLLTLLGERSITAIDLGELLRHPVAVTVFSALLLGMGALLLAQALVMLVVAGRRLRPDPASPPLGRELRDLARRLAHPSTLLLLPYSALLLPFGGLALGGLFTGGIRLPFPLTSELLSTPAGTIAYLVMLVLALYVEARLVLTLPLLAGGYPDVRAAMIGSWRETRGRVWRIAAIIGIVILATVVVVSGVGAVGLAPTRYADSALPEWAPLVAAVSLTLIEIAVFFVIGFAIAVLAHAAMRAVRHRTEPLDPAGPTVRMRPLSRRIRRAVVIGVGAVTAAVVGLSNWAGLASLSDGTATELVAHRGVFSDSVENTIAALEAAAAGRPDYVEIDVQQARGGGFVVFHDATLRRLAGDPRPVWQLSAFELTQVAIRQHGREDRIPTLNAVLRRAAELNQPLFLELKTHGHETDDYLERLIDTLRRYDALDTVRIASFDQHAVEEFALLEPTVPAGLVLSITLGRAPATSADFLVVNASSYTPALRDDAWARGLELYVWTVDDMRSVRDLLRDSVDGIITNRTFAAQAEQQNIRYETGIARRLEDALRRFLGW